ncbi:unnamed protein product [Candida verbasci]|uniref:Uncharacterized protein n=1 Tax=Candida verbasci TaxID=1227364 RepID=A0A9W4TWR2_9ASCO|nr:unnamed protein product [Candida verbasci]
MVDFNVNGKSAVITGGTRGLGLYCAEALVVNGASIVIITSRKAKAGEEARQYLLKKAEEANNSKCQVISIPADLSNDQDCLRFFEDSNKFLKGKLDILIANAGATWGAPLEQHQPEHLRKVLNLNVVALYHTIKLFVPLLEKATNLQDPSRILLMSSIISVTTSDHVGVYGYLASKAAVTHLGRNLAVQFGSRNINVNSIAPGFFPSKMANGLIEAAGSLMTDTNPRHRLGEKEDLQNLVLFLCSKQSNYLNGVFIPIDGGAHLNQPAAHF